jgi:hypothetical protein
MAILVMFVLSAIDFIQSAFDMKIAYLVALSRARRDEDRDPSRRILAAIRAGEAPASFGVPRRDPRKKGTFRPSS